MEANDDSSAGSGLLRPVRPPVQPNRPATTLAALLGRAASGRRRRPSALVRETAALQLEERRADWAYSRPVVALDIGWNLAFVASAVAVLAASVGERPTSPLRLWIAGYGLQCLVHVALVWTEYRRRRRRSDEWRRGVEEGGGGGGEAPPSSDSEPGDSDEEGDGRGSGSRARSSFAKRCESFNTVASFLWWLVGFYWVLSGGDSLSQTAPTLYWLAVIFLAFDVFFAIFCIALACIIGIALCCCLPCIIGILYAIAGQKGASDADIRLLPKYRYSDSCEDGQKAADEGLMIPILENRETPLTERVLLHEDAECCICLLPYEDGAELHALPCNHHFHSTCIVRWLQINATCPLCKYDILKGSETA